jgi:hypothetical protein
MSTGYERQKRYRARQRAGLVVISIAIEPIAVGEWLCDHGFLEASEVEGHQRMQLALQEAIAAWSAPA